MTFFTILILLAVIAVISYPFFSKKKKPEEVLTEIDNEKTILLKQKEYSYAAIKELEFDYNTGKISKEDYNILSNRYKAEAINIIRKLETEQTSKKVSKLFCTECGQKYKEDSQFCTNCGESKKI